MLLPVTVTVAPVGGASGPREWALVSALLLARAALGAPTAAAPGLGASSVRGLILTVPRTPAGMTLSLSLCHWHDCAVPPWHRPSHDDAGCYAAEARSTGPLIVESSGS